MPIHCQEKGNFLKALFPSPLFSIFLVGVLLFIIFSHLQTFSQERKISREIKALEEEIQKIEGQYLNSLQMFEFLKSDFFKEKEAREKFSFQKPGEKAVVILPADELISQKKTEKQDKEREENLPIFKKWWRYLFK